ncbi:DUF305 domain-containing protein [Dietzia lutea]|uniref:DUF305 domain-containing protein n=1 Tax=Dietzia lutea TaxID=546160 RepID=A0A2S1R8H9_9ACTN|nr:DUF305 domain-containing protein [Dietzia lutea]AWH92541.1 DUF305 domain-containing protein [Dietzia lutea]
MARATLLMAATVTASALILTACAESGDDTASAPSTSTGAPAETAAPASGTEPVAPDEGGEHSRADVMFAQTMLPHHEQAVEMSDLLLTKSDIPADVTALAEQIRAEQGPEIEQMTAWLEQWGEPLSPEGGHGGQHGGHGGDMAGMEGMLSQTELEQLADAEGTDAARLFLEGMIAHHEGAIDMARQEVDEGSYQPAVDLARSIIETQQDEIATMRDMLSGV